MIGYLNGKIISLKPTKLLLDVGGVGYSVNISINTFENISDKKEISLHIYTSVKEDSITLFGFFNETEKEMFELLISVNGIGPKLGLSILAGIQVNELKEAIESGNVSRLIAIPGVGRKTAERVVLELRSKVDKIKESEGQSISYSIKQEAISALTTLGYNYKMAGNVVRDILSSSKDISLEELIKNALGNLNK
ncbi:MAG TPA: Holliday junction branch migration protein RuvA [Ignavibacteriaceae bacterium]|nr:Holliday junction branch migration protein RuvA [Ignavibacteriaceae bacterium]